MISERGAAIAALVERHRAGEISKNDLFQMMARVQGTPSRASRAAELATPTAAAPPTSVSSEPPAAHRGAARSGDVASTLASPALSFTGERSDMVQRLLRRKQDIERRRLAASLPPSSTAPAGAPATPATPAGMAAPAGAGASSAALPATDRLAAGSPALDGARRASGSDAGSLTHDREVSMADWMSEASSPPPAWPSLSATPAAMPTAGDGGAAERHAAVDGAGSVASGSGSAVDSWMAMSSTGPVRAEAIAWDSDDGYAAARLPPSSVAADSDDGLRSWAESSRGRRGSRGSGDGSRGSRHGSDTPARAAAAAAAAAPATPMAESHRRPSSARRARPRSSDASHGRRAELMRSRDDSSYVLRREDATVPVSFSFELSRRKPESRTERAEMELKLKQAQECTFRPRITPLPPQYGSTKAYAAVPFYERVMRWKDAKRDEAEKREGERAVDDMDGCTFKPQLSEATRRMTERVAAPVVDRLYKAEPRKRKEEVLEAKRKEREDAEIAATCTFKPKLVSRPSTPGITSRYRSVTPSSSRARGRGRAGGDRRGARDESPPPLMDEEATFTPRTNPLRKGMGSAELYLRTNVFERLSRSSGGGSGRGGGGGGADDGDEEVMEAASFLSEMDGDGRSASTPRSRSGSIDSTSSKKSFNEFIARQRQLERRREKRVKELRARSTPSHKPKLCKKSRALTKRHSGATFLQRLARDSLRKERSSLRVKAEVSKDPEATFTPAINPASRALAARSPSALSFDDQVAKETRVRDLKLRADKAEMEGVTFRPTISRGSRHAESKLKVVSDPKNYLKRLQQQKKERADRERRLQAEREMAELEHCRFKPETHACPAYITRIARSMALTRKSKAAEAKEEKPRWR
eukprot:PLAT2226.1.p1 GENE.PLAT2226.1~~PLAT2226.1.p1  ORF type:complete len:873 (-),score=343.80 PLAT2226.1:94-2712(-)